jgi:hypothetical protein
MIHTRSDLGSILPDPVLDILGPGGLELLLADGAWGVAEGSIVGGTNPWLSRFLLGGFIPGGSFGGSLGVCGTVFVSCLAGFDPILVTVRTN